MAYTYAQTKQDEEIAVLGAYPYRYEFNLFSAADIRLIEIIVPCKSNIYDQDGQVKEVQVTLTIGSQSVTETVGKDYVPITLNLSDDSVLKNNTITVRLTGDYSIKIWVGYNITAYSSGYIGILNISETLPNFTVTYTVDTEEWFEDAGINDGYPYYTWAIKQDISGETDPPKPWWDWKIDTTKEINDGYPYIIDFGGGTPTETGVYYGGEDGIKKVSVYYGTTSGLKPGILFYREE